MTAERSGGLTGKYYRGGDGAGRSLFLWIRDNAGRPNEFRRTITRKEKYKSVSGHAQRTQLPEILPDHAPNGQASRTGRQIDNTSKCNITRYVTF